MMPDSLRSRCIEAGAQAYEQESHGMADDATWEAFKTQYPDDYTDMLREMGAALDAMLDCLTDALDEWAEATHVPTLVGGDALALLAVLRNP